MKFLKLLNLLNPLLYYYKYSYRPRFPINPYKQITEVVGPAPFKKEGNAKKILIVPFRMAPVSNLFEGNCALIFQARGYDVDALLCGQSVDYCEQIDSKSSPYLKCNLCFYEQNKFLSAFGVNGVFINQYVSWSERKEIDKEVSLVDIDNLVDYTYKDVPIYRPLSSAVQRYFKKATFCPKRDEKILRGYLKTIFMTICALDNYLSQNKVELILLSHGVYSTWGAVLEFCVKRSLKFVTWGRVYHGAGVIAAHNASYLSEPMYETNSNWDHKALTTKQRDQIFNYLQGKIGIGAKSYDYVDYNAYTKRFLPKEDLYKQLNLSEGKKIVALFPNIPWDGQTFRPNLIFNNINSWIYETIDWFAKRKDAVLIIRTHPAEKYYNSGPDGLQGVIEERYGQDSLPDNIILIPADSHITSLSIASISCAALLYGSTIGYETVFLKVPTILASEFFYSNKEISFDPKTKNEYFSLITRAIEGDLHVDDARYERLLQYAYHYQFRRVMPETLMALDGLKFTGYKYDKLQEFIDDKVINKFVNQCLTGEKFYFDDCYE